MKMSDEDSIVSVLNVQWKGNLDRKLTTITASAEYNHFMQTRSLRK